ncbi:uncharacterized protein F4812DRAFT_457761 [Daldinia caldariorum]|uniref:uncharacterized protein n=1 Tax=Daldinia caldariorum TaxID=326644 RepID=UPI00200782B5|nr:uncharacterized protein F4812DRAFT_457761 [Daldinia caldariorum]KAI1469221.1 hypothetical protein F4812DRAFT_457761 [Daldinia caldariorum]
MDHNRNKAIRNERSNIPKPQVFVQLAFGVSWSERHTPQMHSMTYMSRNLKNARDSGNFPRQVPPPNANFLGPPESLQQRSREHPSRHHRQHNHIQTREPGRSRGQNGHQPHDQVRPRPRRNSLGESRGERGRSAPPLFSDSPWDIPHVSASLFPQCSQKVEDQSSKELPAVPSQFRLGEEELPWSSYAWPFTGDPENVEDEDDEDEDEDGRRDLPFQNRPTTIPLASERPSGEDADKVRELESLSTAMMTVDNGFEHQWWYQGPRQSMERWWTRASEEEDDARSAVSAQAVLLSDIPPPSALDPDDNNTLLNFNDIVSPISEASSPAPNFAYPLHRSLTTRSDELWLEI